MSAPSQGPEAATGGTLDRITRDTLLGGRVRLAQPMEGFRAAIDPVLLAAVVAAQPGERVLDVGTGTGAAALCLAVRLPGVMVTALERDPAVAALAARNVGTNGLDGRVEVVVGDLLRPPAVLAPGSFDWAMANPPHLRAGTHTPSAATGRAQALGEGEARLADWIDFLHGMVRPRGWVAMVHRADRLDELMALCHRRFGEIAVLPLWPRVGAPARRVVVAGRRDGRGPARLNFGLVLHGSDGAYTAAADAVLRDAAALAL